MHGWHLQKLHACQARLSRLRSDLQTRHASEGPQVLVAIARLAVQPMQAEQMSWWGGTPTAHGMLLCTSYFDVQGWSWTSAKQRPSKCKPRQCRQAAAAAQQLLQHCWLRPQQRCWLCSCPGVGLSGVIGWWLMLTLCRQQHIWWLMIHDRLVTNAIVAIANSRIFQEAPHLGEYGMV
jgi:hypothetical protein